MAFIFVLDLWNILNIRGVVILSLLLQVFLILFGSLKKKIADNPITLLLWLAYLMADSVVVYGIGLISRNQGNPFTCGAEVNRAIQALWASFLLLHLGGPDNITSSSLEDSSLWKRHLFSLLFQVCTAIYVFMQIFPKNELLVIPTMLVFSLGVIKNAERIVALYLSSLPRMRKLMYPWGSDVLSKKLFPRPETELLESTVVEHAYGFFQTFKVFLVDLIFTQSERQVSYKYFRNVSALDALRVISVELQFMYEMLHTKALIRRSKWSYIFRFIALNVIAVVFILFNRLKKHLPYEEFYKVDIKITYFLLYGEIALDMMGLFMLVFSDWNVGEIMWHHRTSDRLNSFLHKVVWVTDYLRKPRFTECEVESNAGLVFKALDTPLIFRRWSESISACSLFSEIMKVSPRKMKKKCNRGWIGIVFYNISSFLSRMAKKITSSFRQTCEVVIKGCLSRKISMIGHTKFVSKNPFINELWIYIFAEVKRKSIELCDDSSEPRENPIEVKAMFEARGDLFLKSSKLEMLQEVNFQPYITNCNYVYSILYWHIATEWWYNIEESIRTKEREFSKTLSDYMLYLLLNRPNVMLVVAGNAQFTSRQILKELHSIIRSLGAVDVKGLLSKPLSEVVEKSIWRVLVEEPAVSKASQGFELAQKLGELGERKWEVMSGVWVEMLCYAAGHIRGESHAQVLSKGGELLAFVWLLMAHFGCLFKEPWGFAYNAYVPW